MRWLSGAISMLVAWLDTPDPKPRDRPFLVDREGVVYPPSRRIVLKASESNERIKSRQMRAFLDSARRASRETDQERGGGD